MNKYILILTSLIIGLSVSGQCLQSTMNTDILYRGFKNEIDLKDCKDVADIVSDVCTVEKLDGKFIVKTGKTNNAVLHVISSSGDTLNSKVYRCLNLPSPTVFLSGSESGGYANKSSGIVQVKYGAGIPLKESFKVTAWELRMNDATVKGSGFQLNENAKLVLRSGNKGDTITIIATVMANDGISRKIGGTWTLN